MYRLLAIVVLIAVPTFAAIPAHAAAPTASSLNLRLGDMPSGYVLDAHTHKAQNGASYDEARFTSSALGGNTVVDSILILGTSAAQARAAYRKLGAKDYTTFVSDATSIVDLSMADVGAAHHAYQIGYKSDGNTYQMDLVAFFRQRCYAVLSAAGLTNTLNADQLWHLAHTVDMRCARV
jgi:hypothetical protein